MTSAAGDQAPTRNRHYPILDALRFVLAFWVAVSHFGMIPLFVGVDATGIGHMISRAWSSLMCGAPAVIVFFVISGFCIHLPFIGEGKLSIGRYYLRRYTRILIPVAGALVVYRVFRQDVVLWGEDSILWSSPLWSLACEEIYYAAYPLLRWVRNRYGWRKLLAVAIAASVATAATRPHADGWHDYGPFGTALILLPVWLLGCRLAEQAEQLTNPVTTPQIWAWRFLAWFGGWSLEIVHFKSGLHYPQTMMWFGVLAYFWLRQEIAHGKRSQPNHYLTAAGAWSYSLYLVHVQGMELPKYLKAPNFGYIPNWILGMTSCLLCAYLFYRLVERPSHQLARRIRVSGSRSFLKEERARTWNA